ncbi:MAG: YbhB/YbcL family Raf kinase inhibitor-like protein [Gammaproteobacteria bacterium]|nr:MAG: YbhB/YbcL family Raf kinase inhibitor-like protein [Gammaproteobacteria bacterium]
MISWNTRLLLSLAIFVFAIVNIDYVHSETVNKEGVMILTSKEFEHNGEIPALYTCDGRDISPSLAWKDVPEEAKSLVLIVDDPDAPDPAAPKMTWVHWVLYNLPIDVNGLKQAVQPHDLPAGTMEGQNDWQRTGYGGPCPPIGKHRYFHKLYALDEVLPDLQTPTKDELEKAMTGHIIASTELIGLYQRD